MDDKVVGSAPQAVRIVDVQIGFLSMVELVFKLILAILSALLLLGVAAGIVTLFAFVAFKVVH